MKIPTWLWIAIGIGALAMTTKTLLDTVVERMAEAIKQFEGWAPGSRSFRNNNPGNIKYAGQKGTVGQDEQGHAIFDTYESGWNALIRQLRIAFLGTSHVYSPSDTLYSFFEKYAEGNSESYAEFVASALGVDPNTSLGALIV
jgi:hypothetical protein